MRPAHVIATFASIILIFFIMAFIGLIIYPVFFVEDKPLSRKERIEAIFSVVDGSYGPLVERTKADLYDPESLEPVRTSYIDNGTNSIQVEMQFRSKNAYGFVIPGRSVCTMDSSGIILTYNIDK